MHIKKQNTRVSDSLLLQSTLATGQIDPNDPRNAHLLRLLQSNQSEGLPEESKHFRLYYLSQHLSLGSSVVSARFDLLEKRDRKLISDQMLIPILEQEAVQIKTVPEDDRLEVFDTKADTTHKNTMGVDHFIF
jgi:hypothetical protein